MHERMWEVPARLSPATEWTSIDEFYADTTDLQSLHPDPRSLGQAVRDAVFEATGLRCTIAVASGKTVAQVAADAHKPDGLGGSEPATGAAFPGPRPGPSLPGLGPKTSAAFGRGGGSTRGGPPPA